MRRRDDWHGRAVMMPMPAVPGDHGESHGNGGQHHHSGRDVRIAGRRLAGGGQAAGRRGHPRHGAHDPAPPLVQLGPWDAFLFGDHLLDVQCGGSAAFQHSIQPGQPVVAIFEQFRH